MEALLTSEDIRKLTNSPTPDARVETAEKISKIYTTGKLSEQEREIANSIFHILVSDHSDIVRESVSTHLKDSKLVPHDLALRLAKDIEDSVALPMLHCSQVLTDDDLVEIIRMAVSSRQNAIADRASVSSHVSNELVQHGDEDVVATLIGNEGADIDAQTFESAYTLYGGGQKFDQAVISRDRIPPTIRSKIVTALTGQILNQISTNSGISPSILSDIVIQTHDKLLLEMSDVSTESSVIEFVENLHRNGHLNQALIIRALCQGDILFFEIAMSMLAGVPVENASKLINDAGGSGFQALYRKAGLDEPYYDFFVAAYRICRELLDSGEDYDQMEFRRKLIERFLTEESEFVDQLDQDDLEYLIGKI